MSAGRPAASTPHWFAELLRSGGFARAYTLAAFGTVIAGFAIERIAGLTTYATIVSSLCVVGTVVMVLRRQEFSPWRLVPITLLLFVLWAGTSVLWTTSRSHTAASWIALTGIGLIAVVVGHIRDTLQTARALGDVMRWLMSISLGLEIAIGIFMRTPIHPLGIQGAITRLGPVQGIFGTRNLLGFAAVLALITFVVEWRTNSVRPGLSVYSVCVAGLLAVLSDSPTVLVLAAATGLAAAVLTLIRHAQPHNRGALQGGLATVVALAIVAGYLMRHPIVGWIGAEADLSTRSRLWRELATFAQVDPVRGWGWFGPWPADRAPFLDINYLLSDHYTSALNAYIDVVLQLGWIGLLLFLAFAGLGLVRAWLVASERRSVVYAWTPLILVALLADSLFESFTLAGFSWLLLVVCAVRAGRSRSWRDRIDGSEIGPALPRANER